MVYRIDCDTYSKEVPQVEFWQCDFFKARQSSDVAYQNLSMHQIAGFIRSSHTKNLIEELEDYEEGRLNGI